MIIPHSNVPNLMLHQTVLDAAKAGLFHIYAVDNVDQALGLLAGEDAGTPDVEGNFPEGSINERVVQRLKAINSRNHDNEDGESTDDTPTDSAAKPLIK